MLASSILSRRPPRPRRPRSTTGSRQDRPSRRWGTLWPRRVQGRPARPKICPTSLWNPSPQRTTVESEPQRTTPSLWNPSPQRTTRACPSPQRTTPSLWNPSPKGRSRACGMPKGPPPVECEPARRRGPAKDDAEPVECEPAKDDAGASTPDPGFEFALEIVEAVDSDFELAGGARQESPVEPTGPDESGGSSGGVSSAQGEVYAWHDGDWTVGAQLQTGPRRAGRRRDRAEGRHRGWHRQRARTTLASADGGGKSDGAIGSGESGQHRRLQSRVSLRVRRVDDPSRRRRGGPGP